MFDFFMVKLKNTKVEFTLKDSNYNVIDWLYSIRTNKLVYLKIIRWFPLIRMPQLHVHCNYFTVL